MAVVLTLPTPVPVTAEPAASTVRLLRKLDTRTRIRCTPVTRSSHAAPGTPGCHAYLVSRPSTVVYVDLRQGRAR
ncbi:hypothetical protein AB0F15_38400 [Amycolatopsis sp. NPDC026612]|uniref:hypothetical protein n=1 Tax=Amycolatopsis sp. NPDC026612 TaxID=3155466 RepID=UPI0033FE9672